MAGPSEFITRLLTAVPLFQRVQEWLLQLQFPSCTIGSNSFQVILNLVLCNAGAISRSHWINFQQNKSSLQHIEASSRFTNLLTKITAKTKSSKLPTCCSCFILRSFPALSYLLFFSPSSSSSLESPLWGRDCSSSFGDKKKCRYQTTYRYVSIYYNIMFSKQNLC